MLSCSILMCAMTMLNTAHDNAATWAEIQGHTGSADTSWIASKPSPKRLFGPIWTQGVALYQTKGARVWAVPGPSSDLGGMSISVGTVVTF